MARKPDTPCQICGTLLWRGTGSLQQPTCRQCRATLKAQREAQQLRAGNKRTGKNAWAVYFTPCPDCHQLVTSATGNKQRCTPCATRHRQTINTIKNHQRRAAGRITTSIYELAKRDGERCNLCGKPIDLTLSGLHPYGPTIDHLIPVADGGTNDTSNLSLAHRKCNSIRRHVGPVQMLLS